MKPVVRPLAYAVLLVLAVLFFFRFRAADRRDVLRSAERKLEQLNEASNRDSATPVGTSTSGTSASANPIGNSSTNPTSVALPSTTGNGTSTNPGPQETASPPVLNATPAGTAAAEAASRKDRATAITDMALFLASLVTLGVLAAWDVAQYFGGRAGQAVMAENYLPPTDKEYEAAEAEWSKGNHMDALNMMRAYLKRNPNEQHVAIRIAEIYEKDLNNYLAAALELEDVLQRKLPREKWGWTAIHLVNIYSGKLNQTDKAILTLQRIVRDYPETAAAKKARQRLGLPEEAPLPESEPAPETPSRAPKASLAPEPENPALPKGFRAKK